MPSKRGKGSKREAPVDQAVEKTSKKPVPPVPFPKKGPSKKTIARKKSKSPLLVPSATRASTTALTEEPIESAIVPPKKKTKAGEESKSTPSVPSAAKESTTIRTKEPIKSTVAPSKKTRAGKEGKSILSVPSAAEESTTAPVEEPAESTVAPSKLKSVSASPSRKPSKKSAASRPPKGQKKLNISSSSLDEEEPSAVPAPSPSKKKKFVAPLFPLDAAGRTRSRSGPKVSFCCPLLPFFYFFIPFASHIFSYFSLRQVTHGSGKSVGGVVDVEVASSSFLCVFFGVVFIPSNFFLSFVSSPGLRCG